MVSLVLLCPAGSSWKLRNTLMHASKTLALSKPSPKLIHAEVTDYSMTRRADGFSALHNRIDTEDMPICDQSVESFITALLYN